MNKKIEEVMLAINKNGEFFTLDNKEYATTTPGLTKDPTKAKILCTRESQIRYPDIYNKIYPLYYLENSPRMKKWIEGFRCIWVKIEYQWEILNEKN